MTALDTTCLHCGDPFTSETSRDGTRHCPRCGGLQAQHAIDPHKFPLTMRLFSGTTGECLWLREVSLDEARALAKVEIPSFAGSDHYPIRAEIAYADGTIDVGGMQ